MWLSIAKVILGSLVSGFFDKVGAWVETWKQKRLEAKAAKATVEAFRATTEAVMNKAAANSPTTKDELLASQKKGDF